jgi:hypothetical protein
MAFEDEVEDEAVDEEFDEESDDDGAVVPVTLAVAGVLTVNWLPVTTVTSAPSAT